MNVRLNQLVKSLLQKESLDQCSLPELTAFAEKNPYFGAAQLLLTKKVQTEQPEKYNEQLQKTLLFFHNPLWVEHLLNDTGLAEISKSKKEEETVSQQPEESTAIAPASLQDSIWTDESIPVIVATPQTEATIAEARSSVAEENPAIVPSIQIENAASTEPALTFEPFFTVDYFASQGVKFKEEEKPVDKFGQQLKSFTDWLKAMKRLPVTEMAKSVETQAEQKVEQLAGQSIADREVVTEAMAEVWEKQGNVAKAIELYSKLSLLEPSKSPYFAAKIEDLKKIN
ncbi:MAG: hypothetical protein IPQ25_12935 [Chitinophagaceae bacterium]|nr:hypothetical protein [Chitinophagaceae bacterium]HQV60918.1 hypothetical protein [Chitinophagaceae bacterium]HQV86736.1 hypothetical protein [Chitinophagaceae bacterium]HQX72441.1 hypothetical protein [Chitinophagaceae bacterium]